MSNQPQLMGWQDRMQQEVEKIWEPYEKKTWVVLIFSHEKGNRKVLKDTKYVAARTKRGAKRTAIENTEAKFRYESRRWSISLRLAHPVRDLGMVETKGN